MFGFGSSSTSTQSNPNDPPPAPSREERRNCWVARDAYFDCLTQSGIVKPGDEGKDAEGNDVADGGSICKAQREAYGQKCGKAWIDYFNTRRGLEFSQRATLSAAAKQGVNVPEYRR